MRFLLIFLLSFLYAQTDHLGSQIFSETWDQVLHIGNNDSFGSGLHIIERSDDDRTTVDTSAFAISDSVAGTRASGMGLLIQGDTTYVTADELDKLIGLSSHSILYDSSDVFVNAPRTIYGWSHDLTFSASDHNTIAWTSGSLYFTNLDTFSIVSGNTGNISAITWIYFYENASSTVLQTTTNGGSAVGNSRIVICVGENVVSTKSAVFQVFGNSGQSSLIGTTQIEDNSITTGLILANTILAGDIAANTITANEIAANTIRTNEILFDDPDSIITMINGGGGTLNITADVINALSSSGSGNRIVINPGNNTLKFYDTTREILSIGQNIFGTIDGMVLDSGMVYISTKDNNAYSNLHIEKFAQSMSTIQGLQTLYLSNDASANVTANPTNAWVVSKIEGERNSANDIYGIWGNVTNSGAGAAYGIKYTTSGSNDSWGIVSDVSNGSSISTAVQGNSTGTGTNSYGVWGQTTGAATFNYGVLGSATSGTTNYGVRGTASGGTTGYGVWGQSIGASTNWAGWFQGNVNVTGTLDAPTLNTGQGDNNLYDMNQNVQTSNAVVFTTVNTGQGDNELYDMDQNVLKASTPEFSTLSLPDRASAPAVAVGYGTLWVDDGAKHPLHYVSDSGGGDQDFIVGLVRIKTDTGHGSVWEGKIEINTFDNTIDMYADGAWRNLASW